MSIFRKKDVGLAQTEMKRHLTLRDVVLLGIGAMVGTGIFTITGTAASTLAGPALIISVLISAVCVGMSAIFFAEFASRYPSAGGVYGYLYAVWGEYPAWMGGWLTMIVFMNAVSSVASGWGAYLKGRLWRPAMSSIRTPGRSRRPSYSFPVRDPWRNTEAGCPIFCS